LKFCKQEIDYRNKELSLIVKDSFMFSREPENVGLSLFGESFYMMVTQCTFLMNHMNNDVLIFL
jgi:hypothetical protein